MKFIILISFQIKIYSCIFVKFASFFDVSIPVAFKLQRKINQHLDELYKPLILSLVFIRKMQNQIRCPDCKKLISSSQIKQHVVMCKSYVAKLLTNTVRLADHLSKDYLQFLIAQLDIAKQRIVDKLSIGQPIVQYNENFASYETVKLDHEPQQKVQQKGVILTKQQTIGRPDMQQQHPKQKQTDLTINETDNIKQEKNKMREIVQCQNCQKVMDVDDVNYFTYIDPCFHLLCLDCIRSYAEDQFVEKNGTLKCLIKGCKTDISNQQIKYILGTEVYDKMDREVLRKTISTIKCCKCNHEYQFMEGKATDAPKTDTTGKKITKAQAQHYAKNRFVCSNPSCKQQQCRLCSTAPYHLGKTCTQNTEFKNSVKCRYCKDALKKGYTSHMGIKAFDDVCPKKQCQKTAKNACSKILPCRHPCLGVIKQSKCLPCLNQKCCKKEVKHDQDEDSYCSICFIEDLKASPCVLSKCGHIFHYSCLQKRLKIRWLTPRILFGFCHCPLCKQWIQILPDNPLSELIKKNKQLNESLKQKALNRLKYQKLDKDKKITDSKSSYYQKPADYAMAIYAYFECFKCKKPYFGGRKSCAQVMNEQNRDASSQFDASKLICPQCCPVETKNCAKHGKQFISFKCRFCCNIGMWFCWGSTHFCDDCHQRQLKGQYITKIPKQKLPKCQGPQKCPLGGDHGQNGAEFSLGCLLCRNQKKQHKEF